jgi:predicted PurR-regulated permease PerM
MTETTPGTQVTAPRIPVSKEDAVVSEAGAVIAHSSMEITRTVLAVLFICALLLTSFWIIAPFAAALIWGGTIVLSTWPVLIWLQKHLRGSRGLATTAMTLLLLSVFFVPFLAGVTTIVAKRDDFAAQFHDLLSRQVPPPPAWVAGVPLVGNKLTASWQEFAGSGAKELSAKLTPYADDFVRWCVARVGGMGAFIAQFLLTAIVTAVLYFNGEAAARKLRQFGRKLAGARGDAVVVLAGNAVRGVALGVVVTALGQSILTGIGLAIAGIPFAAVLGVVAFVLCIAQVGPILVFVPCVIWLYSTGHTGAGTFLLIWTIVVGLGDNVVRPILIKKGADLPLLLIFTGVIGGLISLGIIGIFVGPTVLGVAHTLLSSWMGDEATAS